MPNKIYVVHPISGKSAESVFSYYDTIQSELADAGYDVLTPMYGKDKLRCEMKFRSIGYDDPMTTNHAIVERDHWMVLESNIVYANFMDAEVASIGCSMELAWAWDHSKHVVVAMPKENIHRHAFVLEMASVIFETHEEAMAYLKMLANKGQG